MQESKSCALPLGDSPKRWILGFEPRAFRATIWRANQLRYTHHTWDKASSISNVLEGIRTPDPRLRRPLLYPAELRTHPTKLFCEASNSPAQAGDGNRTHVSSLEGWCSTIELHLHGVAKNILLVGVTGFEPATSWSQTRRSSQAEPHPVVQFSFLSLTTTNFIIHNNITIVNTYFKNF